MNPLRASQAYGDSYGVLEIDKWQPDARTDFESGLWDTVTMFPARVSIQGYEAVNTAGDPKVLNLEPGRSDPRWILEYVLYAVGMVYVNGVTRTVATLQIEGGILHPDTSTPLTLFPIATIPLMGANRIIAAPPAGLGINSGTQIGYLRGTCRYLQARLTMLGNAPTLFRCGVYQRSW